MIPFKTSPRGKCVDGTLTSQSQWKVFRHVFDFLDIYAKVIILKIEVFHFARREVDFSLKKGA